MTYHFRVDHWYQDRVSLELSRREAEELRLRPTEVMEHARRNLRNWSVRNQHAPSLLKCYAEWGRILDQGVEAVCRVLVDQTDDGQRLRQSSPFAGVLSPREVWEIKRRIRHDQTAA